MKKKDELISMIPRRKDGKIDLLSVKGMEIEINDGDYGSHKVKVLDIHGDDGLIYLKLKCSRKYIGCADYSFIYWEQIEC